MLQISYLVVEANKAYGTVEIKKAYETNDTHDFITGERILWKRIPSKESSQSEKPTYDATRFITA